MPPPQPDGLGDAQKVADLVVRAQTAVATAGAFARRGDAAGAADQCGRAFEALRDTAARLEAMGAELLGPEDAPMAGTGPDALPLRLLDTTAGRRLLAALEEAEAAATDVDRERGWTYRDGSPAGWGEQLGAMAEKLRLEIQGPTGRE